MIPILYEKNETEFVTNGLGRLRDCISCTVTEERNGIYELDFEYPVTGSHYDDIWLGRIVAVEHDETGDVQPFDIVSYSRPMSGVVSFHCWHVSYRQSKMVASGTNIRTLTGAFTMLRNAVPSNPFSYETDMTASTGYMAAADGVPRTVRSMLGGVEGSILDTYGGEYEFDRFTVRLHSSRGVDRELVIRYGVNLLDYNEDTDGSNTYTACVPFWTGYDDNGNEVVVKGSMVDTGAASYDGRTLCVPLDLTEKFDEQPTAGELQGMAASMMATDQVHIPAQTIAIDFVRLQDSEEYSAFASLMKCALCDTVRVEFPRYNLSGRFKIVKTVFDVLQERYTAMELGTLSTTLAEALGIDYTSTRQSSSDTFELYNVKSKITPADGVTIGTAYLYVFNGRVAQLYLSATFPSNQTSGTSYNIGTLDATIKPRNLTPFPSTYGGGQINAGGGMSFRPQININGNVERYFSAVYLLNSKYSD